MGLFIFILIFTLSALGQQRLYEQDFVVYYPNSVILKFGFNDDVDVGTEDIWDGGGTWNEPTVAQVHNIASSSIADDTTGTGARTIKIFGLDSSYTAVTENFTLAGTDSVQTLKKYVIIYRMYVVSAGSGAANAGNVGAFGDVDKTLTAQITAGNNQSLMAIYGVPSATFGHLWDYTATINDGGANTNVDVLLMVKPFGEVWQVKSIDGLFGSGSSRIQRTYKFPLLLQPKSLVKMRATSDAVNTEIGATFDITLEN